MTKWKLDYSEFHLNGPPRNDLIGLLQIYLKVTAWKCIFRERFMNFSRMHQNYGAYQCCALWMVAWNKFIELNSNFKNRLLILLSREVASIARFHARIAWKSQESVEYRPRYDAIIWCPQAGIKVGFTLKHTPFLFNTLCPHLYFTVTIWLPYAPQMNSEIHLGRIRCIRAWMEVTLPVVVFFR